MAKHEDLGSVFKKGPQKKNVPTVREIRNENDQAKREEETAKWVAEYLVLRDRMTDDAADKDRLNEQLKARVRADGEKIDSATRMLECNNKLLTLKTVTKGGGIDVVKAEKLLKAKNLFKQALSWHIDPEKLEELHGKGLLTAEDIASFVTTSSYTRLDITDKKEGAEE